MPSWPNAAATPRVERPDELKNDALVQTAQCRFEADRNSTRVGAGCRNSRIATTALGERLTKAGVQRGPEVSIMKLSTSTHERLGQLQTVARVASSHSAVQATASRA
jgi:hypothetical protein